MPPDRENHLWLRAKHFMCQLHRRSLGGISLHDQVASLDIPEPTKSVEKRSPAWKTAGFGDLRYRESKRSNGNTMDLRGLLGPCPCKLAATNRPAMNSRRFIRSPHRRGRVQAK